MSKGLLKIKCPIKQKQKQNTFESPVPSKPALLTTLPSPPLPVTWGKTLWKNQSECASCLICFLSLRGDGSSDPACTGCFAFLLNRCFICLSNFYNYFGRKIHLIQVIPPWPEPEAVCYFHLLSPFSKVP